VLAASNFTYSVVGAPVAAGTQYGAFLAIGGSVPLVGNADVASLRVHVSDTAGVFGAGGTDLPQIVLAISRNGAGPGIGNYNIVALGGVAGGNAALILDNGLSGSFRALGVDNQALAAPLPVGDLLSISAALTAFSDPASFDTFDPSLSLDLLGLTGPLPDFGLVSSDANVSAPEPSGLSLAGVGLAGLLFFVLRKRPQSGIAR
jgi:hypothetical protein